MPFGSDGIQAPSTTAPGVPTIGTATAGYLSATVTWTAPASTGGTPITGYVVTPYIAGVAQTPQTFASTATSEVVTGLTNGTAYTFKVAAINAVGTGPNSAATAAVTPFTIAPDAFADGGINYGGLSQTWAHTCGVGSASTGLLFVACYGDTSNAALLTGVTYNGVAMTPYGSPILVPGGDRYFYLFYLLGPAAGTHNVVISASTSIVLSGQSASYLKVSQSGFPDAHTTATSASATALSGTVTTVAPGAWTFIAGKDSGATPTVTTGTQRLSNGSTNLCMGDSNGPLAPGLHTLTMSNSVAAVCGLYVVSFAP